MAIDYSLLLVSRWREERARGHDNEEAVVIAMRTAGHAVLASGVTVAISLVALVVVPVPFLRSMGLGGMLIPLVSVAVVLTLLPALLSSIGPRVDWPRIRHEGVASRGWSAWARLIVAHRFVAAGGALVILALLVAPVLGLKIGQSGVDSLARSGPAHATLQQLRADGIGTGVLTPMEVLVSPGQGQAAAHAAAGVAGVRTAAAGRTRDGLTVVDVVPDTETVDSTGTAVVDAVRSAVEGATTGPVLITGAGATVEDYFSAVYAKFPYVLALIALITFVLLARTFRSLLLPIKAVVLNLVSLSAVFGAIVFFWQRGHGSDLRLQRHCHGCHHLLAAGGDLRLPLRSVHGLRGLHLDPDERGVRLQRVDGQRQSSPAWADGAARHVGGPDLVLRLRCSRVCARTPISRCSVRHSASAS